VKVSPGRLAVVVLSCLALFNVAARKDTGPGGGGRKGQQAAAGATAAAVPGMPTTLTKSLAIDALIQALAMNSTPEAEKSLEKIVTGEMDLGAGHAKQGAQQAVISLAMRWVMRPSPESDAFLARIFADPDDVIRTTNQTIYSAADLRNDTALVLAKIGSPGVRLAVAKVYTQPSTQPATREAIEKVIRGRVPANFAAQVEVFRGADTPEVLKAALEKTLLKQNEAAMKAALKLATDEKAKPAAAGGSPFSPMGGKSKAAPAAGGGLLGAVGQLFGGKAASPPGGASSPFAAMATMSPMEIQNLATSVKSRAEASALKSRKTGSVAPVVSPEIMQIEIMAELLKRQPVDPGAVAKDLWNPEFVDSVAKDPADSKGDATLTVNSLASLPLKASREKLREFLHRQKTKGPEEFAKMDAAAPAETPAAGNGNRRGGKNKKDAAPMMPRGGGFGMGGGSAMRAAAKPERQEVTEFGTNWFDPGALVVLKSTVAYAERPPEKPVRHTMYPQQQRRMTPLMEKRQQEKEAKQKALDAQYDWRDAIEKAVRQWDDRFAAVAEEPPAAGDKPAADDEKADAAKAKPQKSGSSSLSKSTAAKTATPAAAPAPTPAVAMPIALYSGETIAKEYHQRWPQDLATNFGSSAPKTEPMSVDYVKLEEKGQTSKTLTHYQNVIANLHSSKPKISRRKIENGTWLDALIRDETTHRTRSIDVIVTKEQSDDDKKAGGDAQITVEILLVEIETPGGDASPSHGKKETPETTSTTSP
jgi:hypothetical protein